MKRSYSAAEALIAKEAIRTVLYRCCRAADRCDEELLATAFYHDAVIDHGRAISGGEFVTQGLDRLRNLWEATHHMLGQIYIELDEDGADSEAYLIAHHITRAEGGKPASIVRFGGRYIDRFECRETEWRIARRVLVKDWYEVAPYQPESATNFHPNFHLQRRDRFDPVYRVADGEHVLRG
jgi:hypothetical protein